MRANQAAFAVGQLADRIYQGYYAYAAAIEVARDPRAKTLVPTTPLGQSVSVGYVARKDGTQHVFDFRYYLDQAQTNSAIVDDLPRVWLVGSLLAVGDALAEHHYFDHAPELELLYHLRNGVAHGNVFRLTKDGLARLRKYPAHNKLARIRSDTRAEFEIVPTLKGKTVLFDFMGPADILDLLMAIGVYLSHMGTGDPLRP